MRDTQKDVILPENADKVLFAEDFMNHLLLRFHLPLLPSEIVDRRNFIHNAFDDEVRLGANYVYSQLEKEVAKEFEDILNSNNIDTVFSNYAMPLRNQILKLMRSNEDPSLFDGTRQLMQFCVKISTLAVKFYMCGFKDAPRLAVDNIISLIDNIDMFQQGWWDALVVVAADYSQHFMDTANNYVIPNTSDSNSSRSSDSSNVHTTDFLSSESSSKDNSEDYRSPDHEMDIRDDQDEQIQELTNTRIEDLCERFITAMSSSSEGPASSSSTCKHFETTIEVITENTVSISDNTSDSLSAGSPKE